jgi:hypothetical protein
MMIRDIVHELERIAPPRLAEEWDNVGLHTGSFDAGVRKIGIAREPSPKVMRKCVQDGIELLITLRRLFGSEIRNLVRGVPWNDALCDLISAGGAVYVLGTSYEMAPQSPTDALIQTLGISCKDIDVLYTSKTDPLFKLAVFTPPEAVDEVRDAMSKTGAGIIGNYSHCSFMTEGTGTFLPLEGATPYSGEGVGKLAKESELRMEMLVSESVLDQVIEAMKAAHPYEEVAYDIYPLANKPAAYGYGRIVDLEEPISPKRMASIVRERLGTSIIDARNGECRIHRAAFYAGAGGKYVEQAYKAGADIYISGDLGLGMAAIDTRAKDLLVPGIRFVYEKLSSRFAGEEVEIQML